MTSKCFV